MSAKARYELARSRSLDYIRSDKKTKSAILDEFVAATGVRRKTAIELLLRPPMRTRPRGRPSSRYGPDVRAALEMLWAVSGYLCSKRLVPALAGLIQMMEAHAESLWNETTREKLLRLSPSTCERLLRPHKRATSPKGKSMTKPGNLLRIQVPVRTWSDTAPEKLGFCEMDLVHHCDDYTAGEYLHSITITDVVFGWTENEALINRSEKNVVLAVDKIRIRMPFPIKELDADCGGEFINHIMYRYCLNHKIELRRARAGKKNDQCRVEQKNRCVVRDNVGYNRYEGEEARRVLSAFYRVLRLQVNFIQPSMKLLSKERIGSKVRKKYDVAKTPCQRILEHPGVPQEVKQALKEQLATVNPAHVAKEIHRLRSELYKHAR